MKKSRLLGAVSAFTGILLSINVGASPLGSTYNLELTGDWEYPLLGTAGSETFNQDVVFDEMNEIVTGSCVTSTGAGCPANNLWIDEFLNYNSPNVPADHVFLGFNLFHVLPALTIFNNDQNLVGNVTLTISDLVWGPTGIDGIDFYAANMVLFDGTLRIPSVGGGFIGDGSPDNPLSIRLNFAAADFADIRNLNVFFDVTPVPIPAAVWLFGSGLLGLVGIARRKTEDLS